MNREKKKRINWTITIILTLTLILAIIIYTLGLKVKFVLKEEMKIQLIPLEMTFTAPNNQNPNITFYADINNPTMCRFECQYILSDISSRTILMNETFQDEKQKDFQFELPINAKGSGQKMFNYKIICNNIKSTFCSSNEKKYFKTALITVNYELTKEERNLSELLKPTLENNTQKILIINATVSENFYLIKQFKYVDRKISEEEKQLLQEYQLLKNKFNNLKETNEKWLDLWKKQEYILLNEDFTEEKRIKIDLLLENVSQAQKNMENLAEEFNRSIKAILEIKNQEQLLDEIYAYHINDSEIKDILDSLKFDIELQTKIISNKEFSSFKINNNKVKEIRYRFEELKSDYLTIKEEIVNDTNEKINLIQRFILYTKGNTFNLTNNLCTDISLFKQEIDFFNQEARSKKQELFPFLNQSELFDQAISEYREYVIKKISGNDDNTTFSLNKSIYKNAPTDYPINISGSEQTTYDLTSIKEKTFAKITTMKYNFSEGEKFCNLSSLGFNISINITALEESFINLKRTDSNITIFELEKSRDQCCIFGECQPCCEGDECSEFLPVIFVHGHAISKDNSPENSHEAFANIQNLLETEEYINAGQIGDGSILIPNGEWGKMHAPISVRVSYYELSYIDLGKYQVVSQKTEKIENYAIRLRELIQDVKERTGKDKVNIVAHSMGGLVTREYITLFGEDDINKVILIGTPNFGIEGRIKRLCSITGSSKECRDMNYDSIFLKRLNSPENAFQTIAGYTITAIGCKMKLGDGDGIVLAKNVPLNFTTNYKIQGRCTDIWNSNLHTQVLNPKQYPETFELIKNILKE